jgi:predicted PurR-regulated permease PerM
MAQDSTNRTINIPFTTLLKVLLVIVLFYFFYAVFDVLALLFIAIIFSTALNPWVDWMQEKHIPRPLGVLFIYLGIFSLLTIILILLVPPLVEQLGELASNLPYYYNKLVASFSTAGGAFNDEVAATLQQVLQSAGSSLASVTTSVFSTLAGIFGGLIQFVSVFVITFYLIVKENGVRKFIHSVTPLQYQDKMSGTMSKIQEKLGFWFRGELILMFVVGLLSYIGLTIWGMEYALVLALWAGLTEIIPYVGPVIGAIPAVALAFSISPTKALGVLIIYVLVQQIENNLLVPVIMKKAVGLNPVISIIVILIGAKIGGMMGALMAIPVATVLAVIMSDFCDKRFNVDLGSSDQEIDNKLA